MNQTKSSWTEILALGVILALAVIVLGSVILNHQADQKIQAAEQEVTLTQ